MAQYILTRRAAFELREIYNYSVDHWGDRRAKKYLADLYRAFQRIADTPEIGALRQARSAPFLMYGVEQHYVIYSKMDGGIAIATILHSKRDIETIISEIGGILSAEVLSILNQIAE